MDDRKIKQCKKCGQDHFVGDGCKNCRRIRQAEWHEKNKERINKRLREDTELKKKRREQWNKYRAEHLDEVRAKERRWRENNREKDKERKRLNLEINPRIRSWEQQAAKRGNKNARKKGVPRGMNPSDLYDPNTGKLPQFCPIFPHIRLDYDAGPDFRYRASVDRIVPILGYTSGNVWVISMAANTWKSNGSNRAERRKITKLMAPKKIPTSNI